jgi:hypothetical protein
MIESKKVNAFVADVMGAIPEGLKQVPEEFEGLLKSALASAFDKMNLVTREEFDVQSKVLARTREKLAALQKRVDALEQANK